VVYSSSNDDGGSVSWTRPPPERFAAGRLLDLASEADVLQGRHQGRLVDLASFGGDGGELLLEVDLDFRYPR
jgi:hypothetical protein